MVIYKDSVCIDAFWGIKRKNIFKGYIYSIWLLKVNKWHHQPLMAPNGMWSLGQTSCQIFLGWGWSGHPPHLSAFGGA